VRRYEISSSILTSSSKTIRNIVFMNISVFKIGTELTEKCKIKNKHL